MARFKVSNKVLENAMNKAIYVTERSVCCFFDILSTTKNKIIIIRNLKTLKTSTATFELQKFELKKQQTLQ